MACAVALRHIGRRVLNQREFCRANVPAILTAERIDPLPLAARGAGVPVVPPVAWLAGRGLEGLARVPVALVAHLQLPVALNAAPDDFALE